MFPFVWYGFIIFSENAQCKLLPSTFQKSEFEYIKYFLKYFVEYYSLLYTTKIKHFKQQKTAVCAKSIKQQSFGQSFGSMRRKSECH